MMQYTLYTLDTAMHFGKHKDKVLRDVIREDPKYIEWAYEMVNSFDMDEETLQWFEAFKSNLQRSGEYR